MSKNIEKFYFLYSQVFANLPQIVENFREQIVNEVFVLPWGHYRYIIDKCKGDVEKAMFYMHQSVKNGWSRDVLLNILGS